MPEIDTSREAVERVAATLHGWTADGVAGDAQEVAALLRLVAIERDESQATFDLRWKADMRAIKRWQAAHPGNDLVWPDHVDLVLWLAERDGAAQAENKRLREALALAANRIDRLGLEIEDRRLYVEAKDWCGEARAALAQGGGE